MRALLAFLFFLFMGFNSSVNAFESANELSDSQLAYYEEEAITDDNIAFELALIYLNGSQGVTKDTDKAVKSFKKLADGYGTDNTRYKSAYMLATLYMGQDNFPIDHQQAENYLVIASKGATKELLADAPYHLAMLTKDDELFISSLEQAALLDYVPAMLQLVSAYHETKRVPANDMALVKWLKRAADSGEVEAQNYLGNLYFNGDKVYQNYEQAFYYLIRSAEHRNAEAQLRVGLMYQLGLGTKIDLAKARKWFELSHKAGNAIAGENLAGILLLSEKTDEIKKALMILEELGLSGSKSSAQKLVSIYQEATLVEKNDEKLVFWQKKYQENQSQQSEVVGLNTASQGDARVYKVSQKAVSLYTEAEPYLKEKNYKKAIELLEKPALLGLPIAQFNLGIALIQQGQIIKDYSLYLTAFAWIKVAANNKQEHAEKLVADMQASFDTKMLQDGLTQYRTIKDRIAAQVD